MVKVRPKSDISVLELMGVINREVKQKRLERTRDSLKRMYNMDHAMNRGRDGNGKFTNSI